MNKDIATILAVLKKSKYIPSDIRDEYIKMLAKLEKNTLVQKHLSATKKVYGERLKRTLLSLVKENYTRDPKLLILRKALAKVRKNTEEKSQVISLQKAESLLSSL